MVRLKLHTWKIAVDVIVFLSHVIVLLLLLGVVFSLMTDFVFFLLLPSHFALLAFCPSHASNYCWCETCFKKFEFYPDLFLPTFCFDIPFIYLYLFFYLFMFLSSSSYCETFCLSQPILYFFLCFHFSAVSDHVHHIASFLLLVLLFWVLLLERHLSWQ